MLCPIRGNDIRIQGTKIIKWFILECLLVREQELPFTITNKNLLDIIRKIVLKTTSFRCDGGLNMHENQECVINSYF